MVLSQFASGITTHPPARGSSQSDRRLERSVCAGRLSRCSKAMSWISVWSWCSSIRCPPTTSRVRRVPRRGLMVRAWRLFMIPIMGSAGQWPLPGVDRTRRLGYVFRFSPETIWTDPKMPSPAEWYHQLKDRRMWEQVARSDVGTADWTHALAERSEADPAQFRTGDDLRIPLANAVRRVAVQTAS